MLDYFRRSSCQELRHTHHCSAESSIDPGATSPTAHKIGDIGKVALVLTHFEHKLIPC